MARSKQSDSNQRAEEEAALKAAMDKIHHKIIVLSGKGGVGKSTVAVNMAVALSDAGKRVGLLDADIHGPSLPVLLGLEGTEVHSDGERLIPLFWRDVKVMSMGFLLKKRDDAVIWRGPLKMGVLKQFLKDVDWGELDFLLVDSPPGTGDEPLSICQLISDLDGALVVTTPQEVAASDVRKSIRFCQQVGVPVLGIVENMSGFQCPHCGKVTHIFRTGGGEAMAQEYGVPFLGRIPLDPAVGEACEEGKPFVQSKEKSPAREALEALLQPVLKLDT